MSESILKTDADLQDAMALTDREIRSCFLDCSTEDMMTAMAAIHEINIYLIAKLKEAGIL